MKKLLAILLLVVSGTVSAGQFSWQEDSWITQTTYYHGSQDRRIQLNIAIDEKKYIYLGYRQFSVLPYYGGFQYKVPVIGFGAQHKSGDFTFYGQLGVGKISDDFGGTKDFDENLYHYFTHKFGPHPTFKHYSVRHDDYTPVVQVGVDFAITNNFGVKFSYQHMKIKEVLIGHFSDNLENKNVWWDINNRNISNIGAGFYYNF